MNRTSFIWVIEARAPKTAFVEGQVGYLVSSCSFKDGKTGLDLAKAWNAYNDENGFEDWSLAVLVAWSWILLP